MEKTINTRKIEKNALWRWIAEVQELTNPSMVVVIDGSKEQEQMLYKEAVEAGELHELNQEIMPGCYLARSNPNDVARSEKDTYICTSLEKDAGPTNNWCDPLEMRQKLYTLFNNSMKGKTMYIIPYRMGPKNFKESEYCIEITDSRYVVLNMLKMAECGQTILEEIGDSDNFIKGVHSVGNLDKNTKFIVHFPETNEIHSYGTEYGGNVLHGKKCVSLRLKSYRAKNKLALAEHQVILHVETPNKEEYNILAAFPSACGKTNLAMMLLPEIYKEMGYKLQTIGDDIAWLAVENNRLYAVNPESGFFGVIPGTSRSSNFNAMETIKENTIFTNVALDLDNNMPWWEGKDNNPPTNALNWKGEPWDYRDGSKGAHPNARFTTSTRNCPSIAKEYLEGTPVPIDAVIFGGRRSYGVPLVFQTKDWIDGTLVGASMGSETTAASAGKVGVVRRDPMAMLPFCGYNMGNYFRHWLEIGEALGSNAPKIFHVNWFLKDKDGNFIWPGFGENFRVIEWIIKRCEQNNAYGKETEIGTIPEILNLDGLEVTQEQWEQLFKIDKRFWNKEYRDTFKFFRQFGDTMPEVLLDRLKSKIK